MTRGELKKLFKEWTEDYAARREEDRREREGVSSTAPRENWPSVIAQANRDKPAGREQGRDYGNEPDTGSSM